MLVEGCPGRLLLKTVTVTGSLSVLRHAVQLGDGNVETVEQFGLFLVFPVKHIELSYSTSSTALGACG